MPQPPAAAAATFPPPHTCPAAGVQNDRMEEYVEQLCREIRATARLGSEPLQTVYFGGGVGAQRGASSPRAAGAPEERAR
jgi:hypothetical protein